MNNMKTMPTSLQFEIQDSNFERMSFYCHSLHLVTNFLPRSMNSQSSLIDSLSHFNDLWQNFVW